MTILPYPQKKINGKKPEIDSIFRQSGLHEINDITPDEVRITAYERLAELMEKHTCSANECDLLRRKTRNALVYQGLDTAEIDVEIANYLQKTRSEMLKDVEPESVTWLWKNRIAIGKITVVDGDPGQGKSTVMLDLAARVSAGLPMPDSDEPTEPGGVLLLCPEDGLADTIRPRVGAAKADLQRVFAYRHSVLSIPENIPTIEREIKYTQAKLVIIDPLSMYLSEKINSHNDQSVRRALGPLALLAEKTDTAVVVTRHLNKSGGTSPMYRGGGSIGIVGTARNAMMICKDPINKAHRVLAPYKTNLGVDTPSLKFELVSVGAVAKVNWLGTSEYSAEDLLVSAIRTPDDPEESSALEDAIEFLREMLATGEVLASEVYRDGASEGHSKATLRRAEKTLKVRHRKSSDSGKWLWSLPPEDDDK
jgi:hypothetical protein